MCSLRTCGGVETRGVIEKPARHLPGTTEENRQEGLFVGRDPTRTPHPLTPKTSLRSLNYKSPAGECYLALCTVQRLVKETRVRQLVLPPSSGENATSSLLDQKTGPPVCVPLLPALRSLLFPSCLQMGGRSRSAQQSATALRSAPAPVHLHVAESRVTCQYRQPNFPIT
jgi:hypothetical protein